MQSDYKKKFLKGASGQDPKKKKKKQGTDKESTRKQAADVVERLVNNGNDPSQNVAIKVTDNLQITFDSARDLYNELEAAKNEKEYRKIARTHWK